MIAINIVLVCLLSWTTAMLVNAMTKKNRKSLQTDRETNQRRTIDILYGRDR